MKTKYRCNWPNCEKQSIYLGNYPSGETFGDFCEEHYKHLDEFEMAKKNEPFYPARFFWRDSNKKDTKKACDILNKLTKEQIWAVEKYGDSRYREGQDDEAEQHQD